MDGGKRYFALLHGNPEQGFRVSWPDLPGCVSAGATLEQACRSAQEVVAQHVAGMIDDGVPVPAPRTAVEVARDHSARDAISILACVVD